MPLGLLAVIVVMGLVAIFAVLYFAGLTRAMELTEATARDEFIADNPSLTPDSITLAASRKAALIEAGAIDGLSIGYRTVKAGKTTKGLRLLSELELWEVSLVTFPMLPSARIGAKGDMPEDTEWRSLARVIDDARLMLAGDHLDGDPTLSRNRIK